jgi:hypothetical protein
MAWNGPNEACCHSSIWASRPNSPLIVEMLNCKGRPELVAIHWQLHHLHRSKLKLYKHEEFEIVSPKSSHLRPQRNILTIFSDFIHKFLPFLRWMDITQKQSYFLDFYLFENYVVKKLFLFMTSWCIVRAPGPWPNNWFLSMARGPNNSFQTESTHFLSKALLYYNLLTKTYSITTIQRRHAFSSY